jgi:hypothetical protein
MLHLITLFSTSPFEVIQGIAHLALKSLKVIEVHMAGDLAAKMFLSIVVSDPVWGGNHGL